MYFVTLCKALQVFDDDNDDDDNLALTVMITQNTSVTQKLWHNGLRHWRKRLKAHFSAVPLLRQLG